MTLIAWLALCPASAAETPGAIEGTITLTKRRPSTEVWAWIDASDGPLPEVPVVAEMRQVGTTFVPDLLVVTQGTIVDFPNDGPDQHNVHWVTPQYSDTLGIYRAGESEQRAFDEPGVYPIGCHRHPMRATIVVVPSLWFAPVEDGRFRIEGLPPGTHRLVVWSEDGTEVRSNITVQAGHTATMTATLTTGG